MRAHFTFRYHVQLEPTQRYQVLDAKLIAKIVHVVTFVWKERSSRLFVREVITVQNGRTMLRLVRLVLTDTGRNYRIERIVRNVIQDGKRCFL